MFNSKAIEQVEKLLFVLDHFVLEQAGSLRGEKRMLGASQEVVDILKKYACGHCYLYPIAALLDKQGAYNLNSSCKESSRFF